MQTADYITPDFLLQQILKSLDDEELRKGFSKGDYMGWIQGALEELSLDTFYQKITRDMPFPTTTLSVALPPNCFNVMELYVFNGARCTVESARRVWWKRRYNNQGGDGTGYTANSMESNKTMTDPFMPPVTITEDVLWANIEDGKIMFSPSCSGYEKYRIKFNGMGVEIGDAPTVPRFFREAVMDFVKEKHFEALKHKEQRIYRTLWSDAYQRLHNQVDGSWKKARIRAASMSTFEKNAADEYYGRLNY